MAACAAFFKESRMKFANANKPRQKIRGDGAPGDLCAIKLHPGLTP